MAGLSSIGLHQLEEQLTCPVCLDLYINPKTLPCLHSFCHTCLEGVALLKENETYYLSCPTCRHHNEVPEEGVASFHNSFTINNLLDIRKKVLSDVQEGPIEAMCTDHGRPLEIFCETCSAVICLHCALRSHTDHRYILISDSYQGHCLALHEQLKTVKEKEESVKKVLSALAEREGEIRERGEGVLEEIHEMVEEMIAVLHQSERKLTEQAKRVTDDKLKVLSEQIKEAEKSLSLLRNVEDYVEQSLKTGSPQQVLRSKKKMMERMSEVTGGINVEELSPIEENDLKLIKDNSNSLKSLEDIGAVSYNAVLEAKVIISNIVHKKWVSFSLSMEAPDSSLLCVPLSSLRCSLVPVGKDHKPIHTTVTATSTDPGVYQVSFIPSTSGPHLVKVTVYNLELQDTLIFIPVNLFLDTLSPVHTISDVSHPFGVAVSNDGVIIVTESYNNSLTLLDGEGRKLNTFGVNEGTGSVKFSRPCGVAVTSDNFILVSDNHRIQKISMGGDCVLSVGEKGNGPLQFDGPNGIAISPITGHVYVADWYNHRVQVLSPGLSFLFSFGCEGSANGQFLYPYDIAIDNKGLVYVTDAGNNRIQKFSSQGSFITEFGGHDSQLRSPYGIAIDSGGTGLVY
uniref:RING-type domain-containing protein n=1 Tax=Amphimedon queenslandica TaxID=400682 RepID=A0A1X7TY67_AMPQE